MNPRRKFLAGSAALVLSACSSARQTRLMDGLTVIVASVGGWHVRVTLWRTLSRVAVIVAVKVVGTGEVPTENSFVVWPASTMTLAGTIAPGSVLDRVTIAPPAGAGPLRVTTPRDVRPPVTEVGLRVKVVRAGLVTVRSAVRFRLPVG